VLLLWQDLSASKCSGFVQLDVLFLILLAVGSD